MNPALRKAEPYSDAVEELRSSSAEAAQHPGEQLSEQLCALESEEETWGSMNKRVGEVIILCLPCVKPLPRYLCLIWGLQYRKNISKVE